jgi:MFS family permease
VPQLGLLWDLGPTAKAWLTIGVQLGFVAGAVVSATLNLSDLLAPRTIILVGTAGAGLANLGLLVAGGSTAAIALRFATGFFVAGIYPPAFKLMATWFRHRRGMALGTLAAAITMGNATPYLVTWLGGVDWHRVIVLTRCSASSGERLPGGYRSAPTRSRARASIRVRSAACSPTAASGLPRWATWGTCGNCSRCRPGSSCSSGTTCSAWIRSRRGRRWRPSW